MIRLTAAQLKEVRRVRALIAKELPDLIKKDQRLHDAMNEPTLTGALRSAVHSSKMLLPVIADRAQIDLDTLDGFLTGVETLSSDAMDRLANVVKLKIPSHKQKSKPRTAKAS